MTAPGDRCAREGCGAIRGIHGDVYRLTCPGFVERDLCPACGSTRPHLCDVSPPPEPPDVRAAFDAAYALECALRAVTVRERQFDAVGRAAWAIARALHPADVTAQTDADASDAHARLAEASAELLRAIERVAECADAAARAADAVDKIDGAS